MGNKRQRLAKQRRVAGDYCSFCVVGQLWLHFLYISILALLVLVMFTSLAPAALIHTLCCGSLNLVIDTRVLKFTANLRLSKI